MTGPGRRFDPAELHGVGSSTDALEALAAAREIEALAARDMVVPTADFDDRVMAAIALEAPPRLVVARGRGIGGRITAFVGSIGAAWRVATAGGRPVAVRAQALAFVLLVALAGGSLASVAAIGAANLLGPRSEPSPRVAPVPTAAPTPTATPSERVEPSETPIPTSSPVVTETPSSTDDHGSARPDRTPRPTRTPRATETPEPHESESPDDHGGGGGGGGSGSGGSGSGSGSGGSGGGGGNGSGGGGDDSGSGGGG